MGALLSFADQAHIVQHTYRGSCLMIAAEPACDRDDGRAGMESLPLRLARSKLTTYGSAVKKWTLLILRGGCLPVGA